MIYPNEYLVWDLETSGLDPATDKILEIGLMHIRDGQVIESRNWMLNQGITVPDQIVQITGITQEMVDGGVEPKVAVAELLGYLEIVRYAHLTHNGFRFDIPFLLKAVSMHMDFTGEQWDAFKIRLYAGAFDTAVIYKAKQIKMDHRYNENFAQWAKRVMEVRAFGVKYNVAHCCAELGVDTSTATFHRALGDVQLTNEIFKKLL